MKLNYLNQKRERISFDNISHLYSYLLEILSKIGGKRGHMLFFKVDVSKTFLTIDKYILIFDMIIHGKKQFLTFKTLD